MYSIMQAMECIALGMMVAYGSMVAYAIACYPIGICDTIPTM
jgi:hypothetical protein